jgi:hypothetical protein
MSHDLLDSLLDNVSVSSSIRRDINHVLNDLLFLDDDASASDALRALALCLSRRDDDAVRALFALARAANRFAASNA